MPRDANGNLLQAGDRVIIRCVVQSFEPRDQWANVALRTVRPMFPSEDPTNLRLNVGQVELEGAPPPADDAEASDAAQLETRQVGGPRLKRKQPTGSTR